MPDIIGLHGVHQDRERATRERVEVIALELVEIGAYVAGTDPEADAAIARMPQIEAFLRQSMDEQTATADTWSHPYSRQQAVYPRPFVRANKFWPAVGRINDAHGDRSLICSCPPVEA